ncbi:MAG: methyltransferase family protein [Candidatus Hodarchaeota archaeon]
MSNVIIFIQMILAIPFIFIFAGILLFIPAGVIDWVEGWIFILLLVVYYVTMTIYFIINDPSTLIKRKKLSASKFDNIFLVIFGILFFPLIVLPGFDYNYQWTQLPGLIKIIGFLGIVFSYLINFWVMKVNSYASKGLIMHKNHLVITIGPYGIVRHPMYVSFILLAFSTPIALGSLISLILAVPIPFLLAFRIHYEEKMLKKELIEYLEYTKEVPYRLIPKIW